MGIVFFIFGLLVSTERSPNIKKTMNTSGTFQGYITGTVKLVFIVFFIFGLLSVLTMMLMSYARYMARGSRNQHGFHKPPSLNHRQKLQKLQEQMGQPVESSAQSDML